MDLGMFLFCCVLDEQLIVHPVQPGGPGPQTFTNLAFLIGAYSIMKREYGLKAVIKACSEAMNKV